MLFISDIVDAIDNKANLILYADDSKIYSKCNKGANCQDLAYNLNELEKWCRNWELYVNSEKCEVLIIGKNNPNFQYELNGNIIPTKNYSRDLGVLISDDLYYRQHYVFLTRNCHYLCKRFRN